VLTAAWVPVRVFLDSNIAVMNDVSIHPRERDPDTGQVFWAPRTIIYPMAVADLMDMIKTGHTNLIPDDLAGACGDIAILTSA
jgi:hypothetical protein